MSGGDRARRAPPWGSVRREPGPRRGGAGDDVRGRRLDDRRDQSRSNGSTCAAHGAGRTSSSPSARRASSRRSIARFVPRYLENFEEDGALYLVMARVEEALEAIRARNRGVSEAEVRHFLACADRRAHVLARARRAGGASQSEAGQRGSAQGRELRARRLRVGERVARGAGRARLSGQSGTWHRRLQGRALPASTCTPSAATALAALAGEDAESSEQHRHAGCAWTCARRRRGGRRGSRCGARADAQPDAVPRDERRDARAAGDARAPARRRHGRHRCRVGAPLRRRPW